MTSRSKKLLAVSGALCALLTVFAFALSSPVIKLSGTSGRDDLDVDLDVDGSR